eukprot:TRINITY_DN64625_c0_g1_i1.p1 TRINITY_DN64625_c0_g1~~TRINITY_DN64625_c0_g1_i1.p1  ORF type:complete len:562 (+),score=104.35 TRINITY_DN64625_c0_g1_i1:200-1885(+)
MSPSMLFTSLLIGAACASEIEQMSPFIQAVHSAALMQKGLRGIKAKVNTEEGAPRAEASKITKFSDDDESCSTNGVTPGVCALGWLGRSGASGTCTGGDCKAAQSDRLERALISEIESALGGNHAALNEPHLRLIEDELFPMFETLPQAKNLRSSGLGLSSARYLLFTYFLRKHRWYVRGLNPAGDARSEESVAESLRGHVAGQLLDLLEKEVGAKGLSLRVLSVFVATLEHLIHGDERERFKAAWNVHGLKADSKSDRKTVTSVLEVMIGHYLFTSQQSRSGYAFTLEKAREEVYQMSRTYDGWGDIHRFINEAVHKRGPTLDLTQGMSAADEVLERFNEVSSALCGDLKRHMTTLPEGETGRVPLSHLRIASGMDFFRESTKYLRELGALDESDAKNPRVLITNYLQGPSNCDGTTSFYDLCCPDECGMKLKLLENAVASNPDIDNVQIIAQELSLADNSEMRKELQNIAQKDGGRISLHGRAFAGFLHKVSPLECSRPRVDDYDAQGAVPDAHMSFQKAALLKTWSMTHEESEAEVARYGGNSTSSFRLSTGGLRGSR